MPSFLQQAQHPPPRWPRPPSHVSFSKQLPERKRANPTLAASQPLKRTKVARPSSTVTSSTSSTHKENLFNRLRVPDIEYESGSETASDVGPDASEPQSTENGDTESVTSGRSSTPILPEEDEDTEMKKKVVLATSSYCVDYLKSHSQTTFQVYRNETGCQ